MESHLRPFEPASLEPRPIFLDDSVTDCRLEALSASFRYFRSNVPGPDYDAELWEQNFVGCDCSTDGEEKSSCFSDTCSCVALFGSAYRNGRLKQTMPFSLGSSFKDMVERPPILECGVHCSCSRAGLACANRFVGNGPGFPLVVFHTPSKGLGVRSTSDIPAGSFVCEYAGEVLSRPETQRRIAEKRIRRRDVGEDSTKVISSPPMNYIISVREHAGDSTPIETIVDPEYLGNVGRFINHACDPNLTMIPTRESRSIPRLALFANRDIPAQEELTFHYGGETTIGSPEVTPSSREADLLPCTCGSAKCGGFLPFHARLFEEDDPL